VPAKETGADSDFIDCAKKDFNDEQILDICELAETFEYAIWFYDWEMPFLFWL